MYYRISQFSETGKFFALMFLFFLLNFFMSITISSEYVLDLKFHYTAIEAYQELKEMSQGLRVAYMNCLLFLDMPYMVVYTLLFSRILIFLWGDKRLKWLCLGVFVADFFENISVIYLLKTFPIYSFKVGTMASIFTTSKWILVGMVLTLSFIGVLKILLEKSGKRIL